MNLRHSPKRALEAQRTPRRALLLALLGLGVFVGVLLGVSLSLRQRLRGQILARDAAVLSALALLEVEKADSQALAYYGLKSADEESMLEALLDVSRLDGVVAFRVFDAQGQTLLDAVPTSFVRGELSPEDVDTLQKTRKPLSHFHPQSSLGRYFYLSGANEAQENDRPLPVLEVLVPVHRRSSSELEGIGQFLLDGEPTEAAFAELDRNLALQAGFALLAALFLGGGLLLWSFLSLNRGYRLLYARTRELARANRELALRSRVSAIGAVTANLLHGLKNPLAALSLYVEERRRAGVAEEGLDDAGEAARRMGRMIEESVAILAQEEGGERFDYTLGEVAEVVLDRAQRNAKERGVSLSCANVLSEITIDNRRGNLLALAAVNLVQNAVQASEAGQEVALEWNLETSEGVGDDNGQITGAVEGTCVCLRVRDAGAGLPEAMRVDPFQPVRSVKKGGSGVGLAIAAQLVRQMEGTLELEHTGEQGSVFAVRFTL